MSKVQTLRGFINQRLSAVAEEIFELFERTIAEYEEQLCRSKEENERQQKLLDTGFSPEVRLHRADIQQLLVNAEEEQQKNPSVDQEPPEPPHIKEEELGVPEEAEILQSTLPPVPVKSERDEGEKAQSSQLHENQTEEDRQTEGLKAEADGESESDRDFYSDVQCESEGFICDQEETSEPQSGLNPASVKKCQTNFVPAEQHHIQDQIQTVDKHYACSVCGIKYPKEQSLKTHMKRHSKKKPFSCSVCTKMFLWRAELVTHMRTHTREKPFSCFICDTSFTQRSSLAVHLKRHSGEKPFSCLICGKGFAQKNYLTQHMRTHTGEKPFSCSLCGKTFAHSINLKRHSTVHTGEKPFSCGICNKRFTRLEYIKKHKCVVGESSTNG